MGVPGNASRLKRFYLSPRMMDHAEPEVRGEEALHILRVLRMKAGDHIMVFDGEGRSAEAEIAWCGQDALGIKFAGGILQTHPPALRLILAPALIRREKMKLVMQKAVELGISSIWPFECARSVVRAREGTEQEFADRYRRVLIEAMKQSGVNWLPDLAPPVSLREILTRAEPGMVRLFLWEGESGSGLKQALKNSRPDQGIMLVVGPEGGFTEEEAETARSCGFTVTGLGKRILRSETAAITALAVAQYEWGDLGK